MHPYRQTVSLLCCLSAVLWGLHVCVLQAAAPVSNTHTLTVGGITVIVEGVDEVAWQTLGPMLKDQITLARQTTPTEPLADDLAFFSRQQYMGGGWPEATTRWDLKGNTILIVITPGAQTRVGSLTWKGDKVLPPEEMRKFLLRPSIEKEGADKENPVWVAGDLTIGASLLQRRLRSSGYLLAETTLLPAANADLEGRRDLALEVKAGPAFSFGEISFTGSPPQLEKACREIVASVSGGPFNEARVQQIESQLTSIAHEQGWLDADTTSNYQLGSQGGMVDVQLQMLPGLRYRVNQMVTHDGFSRGSKRVLKAGFRVLEGKMYSSVDLDLNFRRALDTGMFALLDVEEIRTGTKSHLAVDAKRSAVEASAPLTDLRITGEETKPKTLGFEVGFDTFLGPQIGITYKNTNLRDNGNTLAAELNWSAAGPLGSIKLKDPAFLNSTYSGSAGLSVESFNLFEYARYGTSLNLELSRRVSRYFSYTLFAGASINTVSTDVLTPAEIGPDVYTLTSVGMSFLMDHRDSVVLPKKGWFFSGRLETTVDAMGSGVSYARTDFRGAWYKPITKKFRFASGAALMSIQGAPAEDIPIDSRVFNGGPNSVRAFAERQLGPLTQGGTPLGGTAALFASAELSYEMIPNLELAVFGDIGSLGRGNNSSPLSYSSDFRPAVGAGLRYHLPFGPIRIDYGHNISRRTGEGSGMLHITVGFAF